MSHDDFNFEPIRGLPEALPEGEHILWQGRPSARRLAMEALSLPWIAGYFAVLALWRVGVSSTQLPLAQAVWHAVPFLVIGALCCAVLMGLAFVQSRATVYTLTNKRVAMRIGAALTMTLNLPYTQIGTASLEARKSGTGTIAFELMGDTRLSYVMTWPHVRPWFMARTQPALRCIPNAAEVAEIFAEAAEIRTAVPQVTRGAPAAIAAE
ncbi:photosynthetic complex putative assembly protein PuhB [Roseovarius nanhaiticus]|uniref:PH domain-containing protein n=1 Tax=Roseovarius nanhaiticus TaxID=573024 RepID=A0A1N7HGP5_9RHOB|nr:photosynthetic complex putative assembly protein PuhB [Roseovarius nanhaiticus]SEK95360.1 PH domain-containing protein [Roseovarius nanhaiticus]SIS24047.1 PH domain-containing protein [Roseovarius nanhaiticus]